MGDQHPALYHADLSALEDDRSARRELQRLVAMENHDFTQDSTQKSLAESYMLKSIQSAILITMSVMHRRMRLSARDYRDLFLLMPMYGITSASGRISWRAARISATG